MNLEDIKKNIIKSTKDKLNRHRVMGSQTKLSITEVAELLDILSGRAEDTKIPSRNFIGNLSLN